MSSAYGNTYGTVRALHTRHIVIRTRDGLDILVPNENLMTSDITNWSYEGDRQIRLRLPVQISYNDDPEQAMQRLERLARDHDAVLQDPAAAVLLLGSATTASISNCACGSTIPTTAGRVRNELYLKIWEDFHAAGISFPFPQRDVYIKDFPETAQLPAGAKPGNRAGSARGRKRAAPAKPPD